jgi:hypothetical protein
MAFGKKQGAARILKIAGDAAAITSDLANCF